MPPVLPDPSPVNPVVPAITEDQITQCIQAMVNSELGQYVGDANARALANLIAGLLINISRIANKP